MRQSFLYILLSLLLSPVELVAVGNVWLDPSQDDVLFNDISEESVQLPEIIEKTSSVVNNYKLPTGVLLEVAGDNVSGRGFIAKIKSKLFVVTNIHALAENSYVKYRMMNGKFLKTASSRIFLSRDRDLAIVPIVARKSFLEIHQNIDIKMSNGDEVILLNVSGDGEVVSSVASKIRSIHPQKIELDAQVTRQNGGNPIIDPVTGLVLAITDDFESFSGKPDTQFRRDFRKVRLDSVENRRVQPSDEEKNRYGLRIENNYDWESTTQEKLYKQSEVIKTFQERTAAMKLIMYNTFPSGHVPSEFVPPASLKLMMKRFASNFNYTSGVTPSNSNALSRLKKDLIFEATGDIKEAEKALFISYFKEQFKDAKLERESLQDRLDRIGHRRK